MLPPTSPTPPQATPKAATSIPGIILPTDEINTLANILAACVNSSNTRLPSTTCATLFTAATPPGGVAPTDTFQAAIDIALNPGNNAATLFGLVTGTPPFQPALGSAPTDFAVGIQYNGGPIADSGGGFGIDIDSSGNAWVTVVANGDILDNVTKISPAGAVLSGPTGYLSGSLQTPWGLAIDNSGNAWIVNYNATTSNSLAVLPPSGTGASFFTPASVRYPVAIAVDNRTPTTAWIGNFGPSGGPNGSSVSHITAAGVDATGSPYGSQNAPLGVAIDNTGNIWVANSDNAGPGNGNLTKFIPPLVAGQASTSEVFPTAPGSYPFDLAIDGSGNVWVGEVAGIDEFSNTGTHLSPDGGFPQNATTAPEAVAIDGLGRAWVSNVALDASFNVLDLPGYGSVTVFSPTGTLISNVSTPITGAPSFLGYTAAGTITQLPLVLSMKIDPSGNLWIAGGNRLGKLQAVTELIGIAAPVVTPLSVASSTGKLGTRP